MSLRLSVHVTAHFPEPVNEARHNELCFPNSTMSAMSNCVYTAKTNNKSCLGYTNYVWELCKGVTHNIHDHHYIRDPNELV